MQKIYRVMNIWMSFIMSVALSLTGNLLSGHFSMERWVLSCILSFLFAIMLGYLFSVFTLEISICKRFHAEPDSVRGRLIIILVEGMIYTPISSIVMQWLMLRLASRKVPLGNVPPFLKALPGSLSACMLVGFLVVALVRPVSMRFVKKHFKQWIGEDKPEKNKLIIITIILIVVSFVLSTVISMTSLEANLRNENRSAAKLYVHSLTDQVSAEITRERILGVGLGNANELSDFLQAETDETCVASVAELFTRATTEMGCDTVFVLSLRTMKLYNQDMTSRPLDPDTNEADRWFGPWMSQGKDFSIEVIHDGVQGGASYLVTTFGIRNQAGELAGILGVGIQMQHFFDEMMEMNSSFAYNTTVLDANGRPIFLTNPSTGGGAPSGPQGADSDKKQGPPEGVQSTIRPDADGDIIIETGEEYTLRRVLPITGWTIIVNRKLSGDMLLADLITRNVAVMVILFIVFGLVCVVLISSGRQLMVRDVTMGAYSILQNIYDGAYIIDMSSDQIRVLKNLLPEDQQLFDLGRTMRDQMKEAIQNWIDPQHQERALNFFLARMNYQDYDDRSAYSIKVIVNGIGWCRLSLIAVKNEKRKQLDHLIFAVEIIDEEVKHEQSLYQQTEAAKASSEAKGRFLANMSHEIRTPINAVLGMNTMILRESKDSKVKEYAMSIQNAGNTLLSLINDILDFSKIESGKMDIVPVDYDLSSLINDVTNMIGMKAQSKGLELEVLVDPKLPSGLYGDDVRIRQVLLNILNNAVKYTPEGKVTLTVWGYVLRDEVVLHVSVKDTGIGIKEEDMGKLFSDFERIEESRNRNVEGTGLGMSITVQLLKLMGSKLSVKSVYGEGSEFFFDLKQRIRSSEPIGDFTARVASQAENYEYNISFVAPDARVLVVDDNDTNRVVFKCLLSETEVQIDEANGGYAGLNKMVSEPYDIIFLDHMMPDMDGIEVIKEFKKRVDAGEVSVNVDTPIIALTANAISGARENYLNNGFCDYLSKPIIPEKLEKKIATLLPPEKLKPSTRKAETSAGTGASYVEELPPVEGLDWNLAALHFNKKDMLLTTVKAFYDSIPLEAEKLKNLLDRIASNSEDEEAMDLFRVEIHALKSSANMIGLIPVGGFAAMLEYASREKNTAYVLDATPHFLASYQEYAKKLQPVVGEAEGNKNTEYDKVVLSDYLEQLKCAAENFDVTGMDECLDYINQNKYNDEAEEILVKLKGAVTNLDVDRIATLVDEFQQLI